MNSSLDLVKKNFKAERMTIDVNRTARSHRSFLLINLRWGLLANVVSAS